MTNRKIVLSVIIATVIVIPIFFIFQTNFYHIQYSRESQFFSQKFDQSKNKVIILGSSQMGQLNATLINEDLSKSNNLTHVYNLAYSSDKPDRRMHMINSIISMKPNLVVYGVGYRDFQDNDYKKTLLPDPHQLIQSILPNPNLDSLDDPKLNTLTAIRDAFKKNSLFSNSLFSSDEPFYVIPHTNIKTEEELQNSFNSDLSADHIESPNGNKQLIALEKMIRDLETHNIKIIIIVTPDQRLYLEALPASEKESFDLILKHISENTDVRTFDFRYKYEDLPIWDDVTHVVCNKNTTIYSDDIAKIILENE